MTLYDVLHKINREGFPLECDKYGIDSRPTSVYTITLCFMSEEETWLTTYPENEILIPWYDCEVSAFNGSDKDNDIEIWLKDKDYIKEHWSKHISIKEQNSNKK